MNVTEILPLHDKVLIELIPPPERSPGGIYLVPPEHPEGRGERGLVLAVGPGWMDKHNVVHPASVRPGDEVIVPMYGDSSFQEGRKWYRLITEKAILAKIVQ